ncbi:MAG: BMC domain-containing protein [Candidatus Zixiibacteriota bacterium]
MNGHESHLPPAIGMIEMSSIARGFETADAMLKAADVILVMARTICSGKYIALVAGDVAAVESSVMAGLEVAKESAIDDLIIPNVHPAIFPAITATSIGAKKGAMGIVESFSVSSLIEGADAAAKAAAIELLEMRLAMALGGKAFVTFTGDVAAVEAAVDAASEVISRKGLLVNRVVIPRPRDEILKEVI